MGKVVGYYLSLHIKRMAHMSDGTAAYPSVVQFHVSFYTARIVIHVKNQPTVLQIKVKCYKRDVYRLPSYMAHVLQHVHTCMHYIQYLYTIFPILYYKLYL